MIRGLRSYQSRWRLSEVTQKVLGQLQGAPAGLSTAQFQTMASRLRSEVLQQVKAHLGARVMSLEGQVAGVERRVEGQETHLQSMFQEQMSKIEELMAPKRAWQE